MKALSLAIILLLVAPLGNLCAQQPSPTKPPPGVPNDAVFFNNKWYRVYLGKGRWTSSKNKCATLGGKLATIPDEETYLFIRQLADKRNLWLGATDEKVDTQWLWSDGSVMKFEAWDGSQPDNFSEKSYLYIRFNGKWHDTVDNDTSVAGFVCEWQGR